MNNHKWAAPLPAQTDTAEGHPRRTGVKIEMIALATTNYRASRTAPA